MIEIAWAAAGVIVGTVAAWFMMIRIDSRRAMTQELREQEYRAARTQELSTLTIELRTAFAALSREALTANTDDFFKLARDKLEQQTARTDEQLEAKKKLIDARLEEMGAKLLRLNGLMEELDKQRAESHGAIRSQLETSTQATTRLHEIASSLHKALAHPQTRGQWGERMAEDVLRLSGMIEGVNYIRQKQVSDGSRPDFTFLLPDERLLHMDVKFPLQNYWKLANATEEKSRSDAAGLFLRDVRARVKEVRTRGYVDAASGTLDYALVFIPNEQVHGFIHENDPTLFDDALRDRVVLCSPWTLYALLSVIRAAVDQFRVERASSEILSHLAEFRKQWVKFVESMDRLGKRIDEAGAEYRDLVGTRTRQLDRQLDKVEDLRAARSESDQAAPASASDPMPKELPART